VRKPTVRLHRLHRLQFVDWSDCQLHKLRSTHELTISTLIQWARDTAERTVYHQLPPDTHQRSITRTHVFSSGFDFWRYRRSSLIPLCHSSLCHHRVICHPVTSSHVTGNLGLPRRRQSGLFVSRSPWRHTLAPLTHARTNRTYTPRGGLVKVRGHCRRLPGHRQVTGHGKGQPSGHTVAAHSSLTVLPRSGVGQCSIFPG